MPLSEAQYKAKIILEVGDNEAGLLAANIDLMWAAHDDQADSAVRFLYAKRDAIDVMLANTWKRVSYKALDGASVDLNKLFEHLHAMRNDVEAAIAAARELTSAASNGAGAIGQLTKTTPITPDAGQLDPSDRRYRGDPLLPPRRRCP
jgi:hypothetical protein